MKQNFSIAIDGPSSSGKSTVAKIIAEKLDILHLNTGSMYRAVSYYFIKNNLDFNNQDVVNQHIDKIEIDVKFENGEQADYLNNQYVTPYLRANEVSVGASVVSQFPRVRAMAVALQQRVASLIPTIMEGRDITTVVLPDSKNKFFITASVEERAKRRYKENIGKNIETDFDKLLVEMKQRDERDSTRKESPLKLAQDATFIDTTSLSVEEVAEVILKKIKR
jgi:cytidylate kinase